MENIVATDEGSRLTETNSSEDSTINDLANLFQGLLDGSKNSGTRESLDCLIFNVPLKVREVNHIAYYPYSIFIGHLYHRKVAYFFERLEMLMKFEWYKLSFPALFCQRAEKNANLKDFLRLIQESCAKIKDCYEEIGYWPIDEHIPFVERHDKDNLSFIMRTLTDATFIIELLLRAYYKEASNDVIFARTEYMHDKQIRDLILIENQLPFFVLKDVYDLAFAGNPNFPSFLYLTCHFFKPCYNQNIAIEEVLSPNTVHGKYKSKLEGAKHFTDLVRTFQLPDSFHQMHCNDNEEYLCLKWIQTKAKHLMDLMRSSLPLSSQEPRENEPEKSLEEGKVQGEYLYSAVLLREAGVKFKVSSSRCLLDIEFNDKSGEFRIPPLIVDEFTEPFYRNLMAWEQHYYPHDTHICSYIFLMEYLIKSNEDVDLLVRRRILINQLRSHSAVVTLFNGLCKNVKVEKNHYAALFQKLNAYNSVPHHGWIAILELQYFSTLWTGVATIAAVILLVLTLIQTICTIISTW